MRAWLPWLASAALAGCAAPWEIERARPAAAGAHLELAHAYLMRQQPHVAREEAARALALAPDDAEALHVAALAAGLAGEAEQARDFFVRAAQACRACRDEGVIYANFAALACRRGDAADAAHLVRCLDAASPPVAARTRRRLQDCGLMPERRPRAGRHQERRMERGVVSSETRKEDD